jgi:hypothetical protein
MPFKNIFPSRLISSLKGSDKVLVGDGAVVPAAVSLDNISSYINASSKTGVYFSRIYKSTAATNIPVGTDTAVDLQTLSLSRGTGGEWSGGIWTANRTMSIKVAVQVTLGFSSLSGTPNAGAFIERNGVRTAESFNSGYAPGIGNFAFVQDIIGVNNGTTIRPFCYFAGVNNPNIQSGISKTFVLIEELPDFAPV